MKTYITARQLHELSMMASIEEKFDKFIDAVLTVAAQEASKGHFAASYNMADHKFTNSELYFIKLKFETLGYRYREDYELTTCSNRNRYLDKIQINWD